MDRRCHQCGQQTLELKSVGLLHHTVAALGYPVQQEQRYSCANCGQEEINGLSSYYMA